MTRGPGHHPRRSLSMTHTISTCLLSILSLLASRESRPSRPRQSEVSVQQAAMALSGRASTAAQVARARVTGMGKRENETTAQQSEDAMSLDIDGEVEAVCVCRGNDGAGCSKCKTHGFPQ
ncbi:uncharacterized protein M421DRAFT_317595 [Didymella exigua CBS 183.55]|uniref:Uncharacterized protein n=1 Tax=Didymella exigua CBS 183.55 TaxID=1150837 RepID=A0A6A5RZI6_9PLEO|nr:uncharacterized protein M421DRAFT_317595 [Didymella exigua CBS 183.55]KAF1931666.1 hypothetical protein M421DRAFT_317595 [Didymella exigua CBS 183.55]